MGNVRRLFSCVPVLTTSVHQHFVCRVAIKFYKVNELKSLWKDKEKQKKKVDFIIRFIVCHVCPG